MKKTVLITGGSGGIGRACAIAFAKKGYNLILVAKTKEKLLQLKRLIEQNTTSAVTAVVADLTKPNAAKHLYKLIQNEQLNVDILINNAGFGDYKAFVNSNWDKQKRMIDLNITALVQLTYLFGGQMAERTRGSIVNIASIAAFAPGPYMAMYYASKAFVLSFSQAVAEELKEKSVIVTAICPGPTKTRFEDKANMVNSKMFVYLPVKSAQCVAKTVIRAVEKQRAIKFNGAVAQLFNIASRLSPRIVTRKFGKFINGVPPENKY